MDENKIVSDIIARKLANVYLEIPAMTMSPEKPYTWASGWKSPIYNDNRTLLGSYNHRYLTTTGFAEIINTNKMEFDYIQGTSLAGIAPASSLATLYKKPLIIINEGQAYQLPVNPDLAWNPSTIDVVASTVPLGIHQGVTLANNLKKPFCYIRPEKKDHGKQKLIEGIVLPHQKVLMIDIYKNESYHDNAVKAIEELNGKYIECFSVNIGQSQPVDIKGKKVLVIEDVVSTGGSSRKEVEASRNLGAYVTDLITIFNYGFPAGKEQFNSLDPNCNVHNILSYSVLLEEAVKAKKISAKDLVTLMEFTQDPANWGHKHGFV